MDKSTAWDFLEKCQKNGSTKKTKNYRKRRKLYLFDCKKFPFASQELRKKLKQLYTYQPTTFGQFWSRKD